MTGIESFVKKCYDDQQVEWMPAQKSLSLLQTKKEVVDGGDIQIQLIKDEMNNLSNTLDILHDRVQTMKDLA